MAQDSMVAERPEVQDVVGPETPPLYCVVVHDDDKTPAEFVVQVLRQVFDLGLMRASAVMLEASERGSAVVGVYSFGVAETLVEAATRTVRDAGFPLKFTIEEE